MDAEARFRFNADETGDALDDQGVYVSRCIKDGTPEYIFETTTPGTRMKDAPFVPLQTHIAEREISATPVP